MRYLQLLLAGFLFFPFFAGGSNFFSLTDIHFDPFDICVSAITPCRLIMKLRAANANEWPALFGQYEPKILSAYGHDTNALLKSLLNELKTLKMQDQPRFVLLIVNYLAHDYKNKYVAYSSDTTEEGYPSFVQKTLLFLTNEFHNTLPNMPMYAAIGNNDSYQGDYYSNPNGDFYRDLASMWTSLFIDPQNRTRVLQTFPYAGYYEITPPGSPDDKILILNSVLFSVKEKGLDIAAAAAAAQELAWLKQILSESSANHQRIWLVFHIPMGIDVYKTILSGATTSLWQSDYLQDFSSLLSEYATTVRGIFTSHLHMDGFALEGVFDSYTPGISPKFGNNSGFKVF